MTDFDIVLDQAALDRLLNGRDGPVAKELGRVGAKIEGSAKRLASGELVNVRTGRYRSSISWALFQRGGQIGVAIGSGVDYGVWIELGNSRGMEPRGVLQTAARENGIPIVLR